MEFNDLAALRYFILVYQNQSLTVAAKKLNVTKAAVTKRITTLELKLGTSLFIRSTRRVVPTPEGIILYQQSQGLFSAVRNFEDNLLQKPSLQGPIRITAPPLIVQNFLGPLLAKLQGANSEIKIELISSDHYLDVIENNIDLALRMGKIPLNSLVGKKVGENKVILCASPKYLKKYGEIRSVTDLKRHPLMFIPQHSELFIEKSKTPLKELGGVTRWYSNDPVMIARWGVEGQGVIARSAWAIKCELQKGTLVPVLKSHSLTSPGDVWLVSSPGRLKVPQIRGVFDEITSASREFFSFS